MLLLLDCCWGGGTDEYERVQHDRPVGREIANEATERLALNSMNIMTRRIEHRTNAFPPWNMEVDLFSIVALVSVHWGDLVRHAALSIYADETWTPEK